jgi:hypothetical protein
MAIFIYKKYYISKHVNFVERESFLNDWSYMHFNCENFMLCYLQIQHAISHKKIDKRHRCMVWWMLTWLGGCWHGLQWIVAWRVVSYDVARWEARDIVSGYRLYIVVYDDYLKPRLQLRTFTAIALEPIAEERHLERRNESFGSRGKDPAAT